ncbi:Hypothetical protein R9X50_00409400 [Acrodontium crateriforme]|uniref:ZZ-type domain-containing protein n=1 Tax=Acrodontium crateriforme TaxID=150365 RepID=A0AAQ3M7D3_9PEZI|nr:Hypothetical protein R9X50_00409400 [Acrodontium crateriforme]
MAIPHHHAAVPSQDTLITLKVNLNGEVRKLKLPLRDLSANVLPDKLRQCLNIKPEQTAVFERFSDSAGGFVTLDPTKPQVFKTLIRAAKAKLKLRIKATVTPLDEVTKTPVPEMKENKTVPTIVRSSTTEMISPRTVQMQSLVHPQEPETVDGRPYGAGIFEFRAARASQQTLVDTSEAPVPLPFTTPAPAASAVREMPIRSLPPVSQVPNTNGHPWSVYCNECDAPMSNAHFHCGICDAGDYDLCEACVADGTLCPGDGHWLIKRFIKDGTVITSQTERISPRQTRPEPIVDSPKEMPGAFITGDVKPVENLPTPTRTCNNCVIVLPEHQFVTCKYCEDFDLCLTCYSQNKHGHHPAHAFERATEETVLTLAAETMLAPGRNVRHNAICDGCDKNVYGVRHKCLNCPDWDFCNDCVANAPTSHPHHRFAALYQPLPDPLPSVSRHFGVYCDGPLCKQSSLRSYITGVRYKCAVCNDTDFCANCEAAPSNQHNKTHPLIKFRTPVRNVSITTANEDMKGQIRYMGDRSAASLQSATKDVATGPPTPNSFLPVETVAEIKPSIEPFAKAVSEVPSSTELDARFLHDTVEDGQTFVPGQIFTQIWTMTNPGPRNWPAGCSVRFVGGDNMLNVENNHPASVSEIAIASESNVIGREVRVGEQIAFKVTLKAPSREGKAISYWRVKAADGTPFGHRLWCDISVKRSVPNVNARKAYEADMQRRREMSENANAQQSQASVSSAAVCGRPPPPAYDFFTQTPANVAAANSEQLHIARMQVLQRLQAQAHAQAQGHIQRHLAHVQAQAQQAATAHCFASSHGPVSQESDRVRKEAAKQRVEHIKAKILKARQERAKELELKHAAELKRAEEARQNSGKKMVDDHLHGEEEVKSEPQEVDSTEEIKKEEESMEGSGMVFPKLDKESPASSTYQSAISSSIKAKAAYVENEDGQVEHSAMPAVIAAPISEPSVICPGEEGYDFTDELEVLSAADSDSSNDGFLTDEEYDILDASDRETVHSL